MEYSSRLAACVVRPGCHSTNSHSLHQVEYSSTLAASIILGYMAFALLLMKLLPGPTAYGHVTPKNHLPVYRDNGFCCFLVTIAAFVGLTYFLYSNGMTPTIVYDNFGKAKPNKFGLF